MNIFFTSFSGGAHINVDAIAYVKQRGEDTVITFMGGNELVLEGQEARRWADDLFEMDKARWDARLSGVIRSIRDLKRE